MIFHIALCSADPSLRATLQRLCMEYYSRRPDACIVEQLASPAALLARDDEGARYDLYLIELENVPAPDGLAAAFTLRKRGCRAPLAFLARTPAHAYTAFRVDAMQYLLRPVHAEDVFRLLSRACEPEYGPALTATTASGVRVLAYAQIEYLECTHHVVHFHMIGGETVSTISQRVAFTTLAAPLLADARFCQPHRSYVVNLAAVRTLADGELRMESGARVPVPRGRESSVRAALSAWLSRTAPVTPVEKAP